MNLGKDFAIMTVEGIRIGLEMAAKACDAKAKVWENMITTKNGPAMSAHLVLHHVAKEIRELKPKEAEL